MIIYKIERVNSKELLIHKNAIVLSIKYAHKLLGYYIWAINILYDIIIYTFNAILTFFRGYVGLS